MVDTLLSNVERAISYQQTLLNASNENTSSSIKEGEYCVLTLHRPATVDHPVYLKQTLETIVQVSKRVPVIFPVHPRTAKQIEILGIK